MWRPAEIRKPGGTLLGAELVVLSRSCSSNASSMLLRFDILIGAVFSTKAVASPGPVFAISFLCSQKNMVYSTCDSLIPHKIIGLNVLNEVSCSLSSASLIASSNNRYLPRFDCFLALTLCCRNWHLTLRTMECRLPLRRQPQRLSWKKLQTFFTNGVHP